MLLVSVAAPTELLHYFSRHFDDDGRTCKLAEYSRVLVAVASVLNLLAVTLERFVVIVFPLRSRSLCTMTNCRRLLGLVWLLSVVMAVPVLFTKSIYKVHYGNNETLVYVNYCNDYDDTLALVFSVYQVSRKSKEMKVKGKVFLPPVSWGQKATFKSSSLLFSQLVFFFVLPALAIVVCYSFVIKELWKSTKNVAMLTNQSNPQRYAVKFASPFLSV